MPRKIDIHTFVNRIWSPDVADTITEALYNTPTRKYELMLVYLIKNVKQCISDQVYEPYVQIKDKNGTYVYNHKLTISLGPDQHEFTGEDVSLYIDFVSDDMRTKRLYCFYKIMEDNHEVTGVLSLNFNQIAAMVGETDYIEKIPEILQKLGYDITHELQLKIHIIRHIYNPIFQNWHVQFPMKGVLNLETKIKSP